MQSYKTNRLIKDIVDYLKDGGIDVAPLITKTDLDRTGVKPKAFIQFMENRWTSPMKFTAVFNIYIVHKTLGGTGDDSIVEVMDAIRSRLAGAMIEYEPFVENSTFVRIEDESFAETNSMTFVYVMRISVDVSAYKRR